MIKKIINLFKIKKTKKTKKEIKNDKKNKTILFSPSAASFDQFKNFEQRGKNFNKLARNLTI